MSTTSNEIKISSMPIEIQESALQLDKDGDGFLDVGEVVTAINDMNRKKQENRNLRKAIAGFVVLTIVLIAAIFGASITAARLSQEVTVDHDDGFAYIKGTDHSQVMKTSKAIEYREGLFVTDFSNEELKQLNEIILSEGDIRFLIKGHARDVVSNTVILLVEGGTITFGSDGIDDATGDAKLLLEGIFGAEALVEGTKGKRKLASQCSSGYGGWWGGSDTGGWDW